MALVSLRMLSFLCILPILISQVTAQPEFLYHYCNEGNGNYTANSAYQTNLNTLLSNIASNTEIDYGFYNFSYGQNSDKVNAIGLCRGDVALDICRSCLNDSRTLLTRLCPNQMEAIGFYDNCMLRYSNRSIFNTVENLPSFCMWNIKNATGVDQFNKALRNLLDGLSRTASSGSSLRKFAAANAEGPDFQTLYGLVQCTPDLSSDQCSDCLVEAISGLPQCSGGKIGGRILRPSCNFRYEDYRFFNATSDSTPPSEGKSNTSRTIIAIVVPIASVIVLLVLVCICLRMRKPRKHIKNDEFEADGEMRSSETLHLNYDAIIAATNNFSEENKLGQGGFGPVYKGKLIGGQEIAVKRLSGNSSQGDKEFKNEVLLVAKLQHRNLVRLLGFCLERQERLLVYEFIPHKSLDCFIFDPIKRAQLSWETRYKIVGGIARGLLYLHEDSRLRVIHRDLKASNVLLDAEMNAKISDFGMARLVGRDQTQDNTSKVVGTFGYMAPEYVLHGQFSVKTDVFSFGVLVLEIVTGRKNSEVFEGENAENLVSFAWRKWREGTATSIVDPAIMGGSRDEIMRCIHIGLLCVQDDVADRPTMASVEVMLNSYSATFPLPSQPASYMNSRNFSYSRSREYNSGAITSNELKNQSVQASLNEASISQPFPR
ncbi:putative receptor-like protein kinase At4g00960 [Neltuma alba]|uniref:putative receptor-like protein kinase At4g00960 n=1 Tax=Neltuma alba TaxID=207710 RepID=UPI0010A4BB68|nr:putative receptor-like protein kinase At4g00960 [Prosopis alba]